MFCVCYASDDNYALQTAVSIISLYENNRDMESIDTYVFDDGIKEVHKRYLKNIGDTYKRNIMFIDSKSIIDTVQRIGCVSNVDNASLSTYVRIYFQEYIGKEYDRLLYIDADTIITGSIIELTKRLMCKPVAAVIDIMSQEYKKIIKMEKNYYYNCGVLLIDVAQWKQEKCQDRISNHLLNFYHDYLYADQDLLNIVLKDEIETLSMKYNYFPFYGDLEEKYLCKFLGGNKMYYTEQERLAIPKLGGVFR